MKRAPVVLSGTALGLVGLVGFHTNSPSSTLSGTQAGASGQASASQVSASSSGGSSSQSASSSSQSSSQSASSSSQSSAAQTASTTASSSSSTSSGPRTAVGTDVPYQFGDLQVKVTVSGSKITDVSLVTARVVDPRSASIDQYAIPQLRSEALSAQSANIQGVSGASYTSQAYAQSLQSALDKLKV